MAITNVSLVNRLPVQIETDPTTPVALTLDADMQYRLKHTGLAEDMSTGAAGLIYGTTARSGGTAATPTAAATGVEGRFALLIQANNPELALGLIGPGVGALSLLSSAGNPVLQIEPVMPPRG